METLTVTRQKAKKLELASRTSNKTNGDSKACWSSGRRSTIHGSPELEETGREWTPKDGRMWMPA